MMRTFRTLTTAALLAALAVTASGCGSIEKLTGLGRDDTVLPGQREDAIPNQASFPAPNDQIKPGTQLGDAAQPQTADATDSAAQPAPAPAQPCKATDQKCKLAAKQAAAAAAQQSQDVFSDPQQ